MTAWQDRAACKGIPVNEFYPENRVSKTIIAVCMSCPVRVQCLAYIVDIKSKSTYTKTRFGVWGGFTARERAVMFST